MTAILALMAFTLVGFQKSSNPLTFSGHTGANRFQVTLESRQFRARDHKIARNGKSYTVDGHWTIGTEDRRGLPHTELSRFEVRVNGKTWQVPVGLWTDCYEPNLQSPKPGVPVPNRPPKSGGEIWKCKGYNDRSLCAWLLPDARTLTVPLIGSDGGGEYWALWELHPVGRDTRKVGG